MTTEPKQAMPVGVPPSDAFSKNHPDGACSTEFRLGYNQAHAESRPQPPSTSAVEAAETHAEQFSDSINEAGDASEQQIAYSSYIAGYAALEERLAEAERILKAVSKYGPQQGTISQSACAFCDMGGAGYASRGDGFHDDSCAVKDAQVFLAKHPSPARGEGVE